MITPAPDPTGTHGTSQGSQAETTYDFNTGLPLTVKNEFGQITHTEYDANLRPYRTFAENFSAPETQTIYGVPDANGQLPADQLFVKVRKQIDEQNWDEAVTWFDGLGRTIKATATDSQGAITTETKYDALGRIEMTSNPYRSGDAVLWSKPRYDEVGRAVESFAPAPFGQTGASLGITSFDISTVAGFVGTVVTSTDASGRKSRSITNAPGQLLRVDEATATGGTETADLGSLAEPHQPTVYKYDRYGKMVKVQQKQQSRYFQYDSLGRLIRVRQPEQEVNTNLPPTPPVEGNSQWTAAFTYDIFGNVLTTTDAKGTVITNTYDKANRVKTRTYSNEPAGQTTPSVSYFYDGKGLGVEPPDENNYAKGKLTKVTSSVSETRYTQFDEFGRLKEMEQRTPFAGETIAQATPRVSKYAYDFAGRLVEETYPSGRVVKNSFEADGDLLKVESQKTAADVFRTYVSNFSYTASGGISQMRLGNGRWETAKFNNRQQVTELALGASAADTSLWKVAYGYGELDVSGTVNEAKNTGNIAKQTISFNGSAQPFVQTFKYDSLYRITEAKEVNGTATTPNWQQSWSYDRYGNRIGFAQNVNGNQLQINNLTLPTVNANTNRFDEGQGYNYDKNGNILNDPADGNRLFVFNGDNKQTQVRNRTSQPRRPTLTRI